MAFPDGPDSVAGRDHRPVAAKTHSRQDAHHPDNARNAGQSSRWGLSHRHRRATAQRNRIRLFVRNHVQGALSASTRVRYRPQLGPTDARHRPDLLQPTPAIDRTPFSRPALSTGPPCSRPSISTGPPAADPRYRPDPLQPTRVIDRTSRSRPALSTGPPAADPRYRPDPPAADPRYRPDPPAADARYRPDLVPPTPVIDRTSSASQCRFASPVTPAQPPGPPRPPALAGRGPRASRWRVALRAPAGRCSPGSSTR